MNIDWSDFQLEVMGEVSHICHIEANMLILSEEFDAKGGRMCIWYYYFKENK